MVSSIRYILYNYNTNNNLDIKLGDMVKISLIMIDLIKESFWVKIIKILNNDELLCVIQNKLMEIQSINYLDEIIINKTHIKEYKEKIKSFEINPNIMNAYRNQLNYFIARNNRMPRTGEFMTIYNAITFNS
jgi:hypothetical protein